MGFAPDSLWTSPARTIKSVARIFQYFRESTVIRSRFYKQTNGLIQRRARSSFSSARARHVQRHGVGDKWAVCAPDFQTVINNHKA